MPGCDDVVPRPPEHVKCKNFGCNKKFDPRYPDQTKCIHHRLPPDKKFLGGADLRAENAPKRLDDDVPVDPRKKLDKLREGLVSIGVGPDDFDRAWGRLGAKLGDSAEICFVLA
eukprot:g15309.t1